MLEYQIVYDYWEGNLVIEIATLDANGVAGHIIRLNDMQGGHHRDINFDRYWAGTVGRLRMPYFVYNPWVDGLQNYNWFAANKPADCTRRLLVDIEVIYKGYSKSVYAQQVDYCIKKFQDCGYVPTIYTGPWFLEYLSTWPTTVDYHWARYPDAMKPSASTVRTFEELKAKISTLAWNPDGGVKAPGKVALWQVSDKWILPGTGRHAIDVNVFPGTRAELEAWFGSTATPPVVVPPEVDRLPAFLQKLDALEAEYR
jgi:GH25 family lysozyme M1 (1,4-beta-N-acetylmuramidase)